MGKGGSTVHIAFGHFALLSSQGLEEVGGRVDVVVISHDHFDHLDFGSLEALEKVRASGEE